MLNFPTNQSAWSYGEVSDERSCKEYVKVVFFSLIFVHHSKAPPRGAEPVMSYDVSCRTRDHTGSKMEWPRVLQSCIMLSCHEVDLRPRCEHSKNGKTQNTWKTVSGPKLWHKTTCRESTGLHEKLTQNISPAESLLLQCLNVSCADTETEPSYLPRVAIMMYVLQGEHCCQS